VAASFPDTITPSLLSRRRTAVHRKILIRVNVFYDFSHPIWMILVDIDRHQCLWGYLGVSKEWPGFYVRVYSGQ
jgi:hypothetical protein